MLKLIKKTNQAGVTLLETILVLSLISIIMVGGLKLYRDASDATKSNEAKREISALATNVKALYASQNSYGTLANATLIAAGAIPSGMAVYNTNTPPTITGMNNVFGGAVTVAAVSGTNTFSIAYAGVPTSACYKLKTADLGQTIVLAPSAVSNCGTSGSGTSGGNAVTLLFD
jgi:type II secretory pathway pseudopilin PulG